LKRLEPNLLLAVTTGFALVLVTLTASVYGAGEPLRNLLLAVICSGGFVLLNPILMRTMKTPARPPLIHPGGVEAVHAARAADFTLVTAPLMPSAVDVPGDARLRARLKR